MPYPLLTSQKPRTGQTSPRISLFPHTITCATFQHMKRSYSDREKAEALAVYDSCGSLTETSRITSVPDSTLSQWVKAKCGINSDIPEMREFKKLELAAKLDVIAHQCAGLLPGKLPDSNVREIVGAMAQSIEKGLLLRGQPTVITSDVSNPAERAAKTVDMLAEWKARKLAKAS